MPTPVDRVIIISPDDVDTDIEAIRAVLKQANRFQNNRFKIWHWGEDSTPGVHSDGAQGLADEEMRIGEAALVIAIFWSRLGTPVLGDASGTAHELRLALDSWRRTGRPDIKTYFCTRDIPQAALEDPDQYPALLTFKKTLPSELSFGRYRTSGELQESFSSDLEKWIQQHPPATPSPAQPGVLRTVPPDGILDAPDVTGTVPRPSRVAVLAHALRSSSMACLCGLAGSGKSILAAQYVASPDRLPTHVGGPQWYNVSEGDTLEEMLAQMPDGYAGSDQLSAVARCKLLLSSLRIQNEILVLDDFHRADRTSFTPLLRMASRSGPCRILLLSRTVQNIVDVPEVSAPPWTTDEVEHLAADLRVPRLTPTVLAQLTKRIGGLPLAVNFFAVLVVRFGYTPAQLLKGPLPPHDQIKVWYKEIKERLDKPQLTLLRYLSLAEPHVTEPVLRRAQGRLRPSTTDDPAEEDKPARDDGSAFIRLQTLMLVEVRGPGRWAVHPFVAEQIKNDTDAETRRQILRDLCDFSSSGLPRRMQSELSYAMLAAGIRACRYAQRAGDWGRSATMIQAIAGTAKKLGLYTALRDLCGSHVRAEPGCDPWIKYHLAHCEFILGDVREAVNILTEIRSRPLDRPIAFTSARILAECQARQGDLEQAIRGLRAEIDSGMAVIRKRHGRYPSYLRYARSTLAVLLVQAGRHKEARQIAESLKAEIDENDKRDLAVVAMVIGLSSQGSNHAERQFKSALQFFRAAGDRRGEGWAQRNLAETVLRRSTVKDARRHIKEAVSIHARIGESSDEYGDWLERVRASAGDDLATVSLLDEELMRMGRAA